MKNIPAVEENLILRVQRPAEVAAPGPGVVKLPAAKLQRIGFKVGGRAGGLLAEIDLESEIARPDQEGEINQGQAEKKAPPAAQRGRFPQARGGVKGKTAAAIEKKTMCRVCRDASKASQPGASKCASGRERSLRNLLSKSEKETRKNTMKGQCHIEEQDAEILGPEVRIGHQRQPPDRQGEKSGALQPAEGKDGIEYGEGRGEHRQLQREKAGFAAQGINAVVN